MSTTECVRCGRPTPDGYACVAETDRARQQLAEIADLVPAARDVAHRQARRGSGGASGKPGSSLPIDLGATSRLDAVQNTLTTWARRIAEERGIGPEGNGGASGGAGTGSGNPQTGRDDLRASAQWLGGHCEWMRHRPEVDEFLRDVEACGRVIRSIADRPEDRRVVVGMCDCGRTLYAPAGRQAVTCPDCEQTWDVDDSRESLRDHLDERIVTAAEAAHLGAFLDTDRSSEQIRKLVNKWAERNLITARGEIREDPDPADPDGKERIIRTYRFGDIAKRMADTPKRQLSAPVLDAG